MLLHKNHRIYCEDFSFMIPNNVVLSVDRTGNDVEFHDPEGNWVMKIILNFGMEPDEALFQSHYDFYAPEIPPELPKPFTCNGISGEYLIHDESLCRTFDIRFRPGTQKDCDVFWINVEAPIDEISRDEFIHIPAIRELMESLRIEPVSDM